LWAFLRAVKDNGAVMIRNLEQLHVECLPADLPERIEVDISSLAKIGDGYARPRCSRFRQGARARRRSTRWLPWRPCQRSKRNRQCRAQKARWRLLQRSEPELSVERGKKEDEASDEKK
jgi:hypothetical protein